MAGGANEKSSGPAGNLNGWAGWLLARWQRRRRTEPRLALVERITLAPRQSLALIEAEGRRILVATSAEGGPAFYPLDENSSRKAYAGADRAARGRPRISW